MTSNPENPMDDPTQEDIQDAWTFFLSELQAEQEEPDLTEERVQPIEVFMWERQEVNLEEMYFLVRFCDDLLEQDSIDWSELDRLSMSELIILFQDRLDMLRVSSLAEANYAPTEDMSTFADFLEEMNRLILNSSFLQMEANVMETLESEERRQLRVREEQEDYEELLTRAKKAMAAEGSHLENKVHLQNLIERYEKMLTEVRLLLDREEQLYWQQRGEKDTKMRIQLIQERDEIMERRTGLHVPRAFLFNEIQNLLLLYSSHG